MGGRRREGYLVGTGHGALNSLGTRTACALPLKTGGIGDGISRRKWKCTHKIDGTNGKEESPNSHSGKNISEQEDSQLRKKGCLEKLFFFFPMVCNWPTAFC